MKVNLTESVRHPKIKTHAQWLFKLLPNLYACSIRATFLQFLMLVYLNIFTQLLLTFLSSIEKHTQHPAFLREKHKSLDKRCVFNKEFKLNFDFDWTKKTACINGGSCNPLYI